MEIKEELQVKTKTNSSSAFLDRLVKKTTPSKDPYHKEPHTVATPCDPTHDICFPVDDGEETDRENNKQNVMDDWNVNGPQIMKIEFQTSS